MPKEKIFYSVSEVATLLKVTRQAILDRIARGTLEAIKIGEKAYAIPKKEVQKAQARRRKQ